MAKNAQSMVYNLEIRRSVPSSGLFWFAAGMLLIPPILTTWRAASFEQRRWAQSDFGQHA
jgi:hypothetical protein